MDRDWRANIPSLGESLGHIFETGLYSDVAFLVGKDGFRINVHKTILSARSEPLAVMFHERWNSAKGTIQEIKMPQNSKTAVKHFLKYLYTDITSFENLKIDDILEITHLAHMYMVHKLLDLCTSYLTANISEKNCLQIHKSCQVLAKSLSDKALQFFLANVVPTAKFNDAYLSWDYDTLEKILLDDREHVPEPILFKALLKWRNVDSARSAGFKTLVRLIRFPVMSVKDFAAEVVPSGVLTQDEIVEVFSYIATQSGSVKFPTKRRESLPAATEIGDSKCVRICASPAIVSEIPVHLFKEMFEYGGDFHKFSLAIRGASNSDIKLYGVQFFSAGANNAALMTYLQSKEFRIQVTVHCLKAGFGATASTRLEKTITELSQLQTRAYFKSPMTISRDYSYTFTTTLHSAARAPTSYQANYFNVRFQLPKLLTSRYQPSVNIDGICEKLHMQIIRESFSLIDGLLFSLPEAPNDCTERTDCKIA